MLTGIVNSGVMLSLFCFGFYGQCWLQMLVEWYLFVGLLSSSVSDKFLVWLLWIMKLLRKYIMISKMKSNLIEKRVTTHIKTVYPKTKDEPVEIEIQLP